MESETRLQEVHDFMIYPITTVNLPINYATPMTDLETALEDGLRRMHPGLELHADIGSWIFRTDTRMLNPCMQIVPLSLFRLNG